MRLQEANQRVSRSFWFYVFPLFFINFFVFGEHLLVVPLSSAISESTGLPIVRSGMLVSIYPIAAAFSAFVLAPFSDRLGRKRILSILIIGFGLSTLGFASATNVTSILTFRILSGLFGGPIPANILAYVGDSFSGKERTRIVTTIMLTFSVASILAVPIGAWVADIYSWRMSFYVVSFCIFICLSFLVRMKTVKTGAESGKVLKQYIEFFELLKLPKVRKVFTLQFFMIIGLFGFVPNISVWLSTSYGFDAAQIGLCYMQGGIGGIVGNTLCGYFINRGHKAVLIAIGSVMMASILIFMSQVTLPGLFVGFFFAGLLFSGSFRMPAFQIILTELMPINLRGRLMALSMINANITMGLGGVWSIPMLTFVDGRLMGMETICLIGGITLMLVPFFVYRLNKEIIAAKVVY